MRAVPEINARSQVLAGLDGRRGNADIASKLYDDARRREDDRRRRAEEAAADVTAYPAITKKVRAALVHCPRAARVRAIERVAACDARSRKLRG
jgi:hypothetical protein